MDMVLQLLPDLDVRAAWAVGLVVLLAVLRPVRRLGWAVAVAMIAAAFATVGAVVTADPVLFGRDGGGPWWLAALVGWLVLAGLLTAAAVRTPLRWEPRTGPGAATALAIGAMVVHAGAAWHAGGGLAPLGARWAAGDLGDDPWSPPSGPLAWLVAWLADAVPALDARVGAGLVGFVAAGLVVLGAERLGRRWGFVGTARCTAAAVAWAPPLLLAHGVAPAALLATAALVWAWWALAEVWGGRHRAAHLATASGGLLGVAVGLAVWPLIVAPFW
ncbi:MAG TPA: hypothetical protein VHF25_05890, partial [Nitriliruptorales bacterium]|nr:hypothetical protein [Nitriliruptorales bacterium]